MSENSMWLSQNVDLHHDTNRQNQIIETIVFFSHSETIKLTAAGDWFIGNDKIKQKILHRIDFITLNRKMGA